MLPSIETSIASTGNIKQIPNINQSLTASVKRMKIMKKN
jgi:hypothetical protein